MNPLVPQRCSFGLNRRSFCALALASTTRAGAGTIDGVWLPNGEPTKPRLSKEGGIQYALVAASNVHTYTKYGAEGRPYSWQPAYRDVVEIHSTYLNDWVLAKSTGATPAQGWIPTKDLLMQRKCKQDPASGTYLKATLRNNWKMKSLPEAIPILHGPNSSYTAADHYHIADILYVFDERTGADGNTYELLGTAAEWTRQSPEVVSGWVRKEQCTFWPTRLAVYHNVENFQARARGRIFHTFDDAVLYNAGGAERKLLATEADNSPKILTWDHPRYPVLETRHEKSGNYYRIGFIGELPVSVQAKYAPLENLRNLEILFVVDATQSMQPYLAPTLAGIRDYVARLDQEQEKARHHFAVAVYRDYEDGPKKAELLANFGDNQFLSKLSTVAFSSDHDYPEAVFNGIIEGVNHASWTAGRVRAVVVIGDHGNHPVDQHGFTARQVAKTLQDRLGPQGAGIRLHAINVNVRPATQKFNEMFQKQMREIIGANAWAKGDLTILDGPDDKIKTRAAVTKALDDIFAFSKEVSKATTSGKVPVIIDEYLRRLLDENHTNLRQMDPTAVTQVSEEGWIGGTHGGQEMVETYVHMARHEMENFISLLSDILRASESKDPGQVIEGTIERLIGDYPSDQTVESVLRSRWGIPFREKSHVLHYTSKQLRQKLLEDSDFNKEFRKEIGFSLQSLRLFNEQRDTGALELKGNNWVSPPPDRIQVKRTWVVSSAGIDYAWVPLKFMP